MQTEARDKVGTAIAAIQLAWHALADLADYIDSTPDDTDDGLDQDDDYGIRGSMYLISHLAADLLHDVHGFGFSPLEEGSAAYERLRDHLRSNPKRWLVRD
jgi:hypothetical protein